MNAIKVDFQRPVAMYGDSVALAEVKAESENEASSILDDYLEKNHPDLGRKSDPHFEEDGKYYYAIVK